MTIFLLLLLLMITTTIFADDNDDLRSIQIKFALSMANRLSNADENLFVSPASLFAALMMLESGVSIGDKPAFRRAMRVGSTMTEDDAFWTLFFDSFRSTKGSRLLIGKRAVRCNVATFRLVLVLV